MAKNKKVNKGQKKSTIVKKEPGMNVGASFSPANSNVQGTVPTPPTGATSSIMYWPSPQAFYQQGKDMGKKAYNEYLNATNQYMNCPDDRFDEKMQQASKMNSIAQSMVQGISIGTEAAENISKRIRTGDQAALIEMEVVKDVLDKLLKTVWVHNSAAKSGKHAGLEVKLLEQQLVTRIRQSTGLEATDYGIELLNPEEADTIWVDETMPAESIQQEIPIDDVSNEEEVVSNEEMPSNEEATSDEEIIPDTEENPEETLNSEEAVDDSIPVETDVSEEGIPIEEDASEEEIIDENAVPQDDFPENTESEEELTNEEIPEEESTLEEVPEDEIGQEEIVDEQVPKEEIVSEEIPEEEMPEEEVTEEEVVNEEVPLPEPSGPDGYYTKEDLLQYGDNVAASLQGESSEETSEEEIPEEDETFYCIECDREVDSSEIDECNNPNCPFKKEMLDEEEEETVPSGAEEETTEEEDTVPIDTEEEEEVPIDVEEDTNTKEDKKKTDKHFVMMDTRSHDNHSVKEIALKEFTGLEGEYCLDCQKIVSYSFDQNNWTSEDAQNWVKKQIKVNEIKNKSPEKIIEETLDKIPDEVLESWVANERPKIEVKSMDTGINLEEIEKVLKGNALKNVLEEAFSPLYKRLKDLEA